MHPVELYQELLRIAGELWTFSPKRLAPEYADYDHDSPEASFEPVLADIQRLLSLDIGRAIRLNLIELHGQRLYGAGAGPHAVPQRDLRPRGGGRQEPLTQIQQQFPALCKIGPNTKMKEIVQTHLPGVELVHMPTPPRQIRAVSDHVYFYLDKSSPLWPEFSVASGHRPSFRR